MSEKVKKTLQGFFGRCVGRPLSQAQKRAYETLLPSLCLGGRMDAFKEMSKDPFFTDYDTLWMEIGFGMGHHLVTQALNHPNVGFIGIEVYKNGVANVLKEIQDHGIRNIRLVPKNVLEIAAYMPKNMLKRLFILFPDPWPKMRHHKRRLVSKNHVSTFASWLQPQGLLRLASDHQEYVDFMKATLMEIPTLEMREILTTPDQPRDWVPTSFEKKALLKNRRCTYMDVLKKGGAS